MSRMLEESLEAPHRLADALACDRELYARLGERLRADPPPAALTIARGSSDHAAAYGAYLITLLTGLPVASLPPSLVTLERAPLRLRGHLALAVSQSGRSPDVVRLAGGGARRRRPHGGPGQRHGLAAGAAAAELVLGHHAGPERSVAATKSFLASLFGLARLAAAWAEEDGLDSAIRALPPGSRRPPPRVPQPIRAGSRSSARLCRGPRHRPAGRARAGPEAEGELRHPRRGVQLGRAAPWPARGGGFPLHRPGAGPAGSGPGGRAGGRWRACGPGCPGARRRPGKPRHGPAGAALPEGLDPRLAPIAAAQALYPLIARTAVALRPRSRPAAHAGQGDGDHLGRHAVRFLA